MMFLLRFFFFLLANVILSRRHLVFTRASDMPFSNVSSPRVVWLYADQKPTSNASKITLFRAQIRKNNTSVFVMNKYTTTHFFHNASFDKFSRHATTYYY